MDGKCENHVSVVSQQLCFATWGAPQATKTNNSKAYHINLILLYSAKHKSLQSPPTNLLASTIHHLALSLTTTTLCRLFCWGASEVHRKALLTSVLPLFLNCYCYVLTGLSLLAVW